jgi:sugar lactone lactonase YvrE
VDILPGRVHALDVASGAHRSFGAGEMVGTVGLTRSGGLVLALAGGFALSGPDGQDLRPFGDFSADRSVTRFNDGKPGPWGNFWAGTMAVPEDSGFPCSLYRLGPDGVVTELFGGVGLSNCTSPRPGRTSRPPTWPPSPTPGTSSPAPRASPAARRSCSTASSGGKPQDANGG